MLISLEQSPNRVLPASLGPEQLELVDGISCPPFASTSTLPPHLVDWQSVGGMARLEQKAVAAVEAALSRGTKVTVVLDSVTTLAEGGVYEATRIIRAVLSRLKPHAGKLVLSSASLSVSW